MTMPNRESFKGLFTALVTPFHRGEVDYQSLKNLVHKQLAAGVQGFVVNGTTGESPTLSREEVKQIFTLVKGEAAGQVPIILGVGSNSTAATCDFSQSGAKWGADGLLVVVPYYNKPPQRGLVQHFSAVARSTSAPIILYNVPSRTITGMTSETIGELAKISGIVGVKEATGDLEFLQRIRNQVEDQFVLLSGDDGTTVEFCSQGGHGAISVGSHIIAGEMRDMMARAQSKDLAVVREYRNRFKELFKWMYIESNPIPIKMALFWQGVIQSPELRLPLVELDSQHHKEYKACLKNLNLI